MHSLTCTWEQTLSQRMVRPALQRDWRQSSPKQGCREGMAILNMPIDIGHLLTLSCIGDSLTVGITIVYAPEWQHYNE